MRGRIRDTPRRRGWRRSAREEDPAESPSRYAAARRLVQVFGLGTRKPGDGDALVDQLVVLGLGRLAANGAHCGLLVVDLARLGGKLLADVLALGEELVQHPGIEHLGDGERVLAFHLRRPDRHFTGRLAGRLERFPGRLGTEVGAGRGRNPLHPDRAAGRAGQQGPLLLRSVIVSRLEPPFEAVAAGAEQVEYDHAPRFYNGGTWPPSSSSPAPAAATAPGTG